MASRYQIFDLAYDPKGVAEYRNSKDVWPIPGTWWRQDPLSENTYIRPNVAGYYPYPKVYEKSVVPNEPEWKMSYTTVCSTIVPDNPQYQKTKEIILYR